MILTRIVTRPIKDLVSTVSRIGTGELGVESRSFHSAELDYLAKTINTMSGSLAAADRERKAQMAKAREIQRDLLPSDAETAGLNIAYYFEPADDVGGDYYDVLPLDDGSCLICVADVTGHGIPAAMTAATIKALLMCSAKGRTSPAEILGFINQSSIKINPSGDFVKMFLVRAFPAEGRIQYASAGHEPAWLRLPDGSLKRLESTGWYSE